MKRILLYLFFLLATPTFFVACEDEPQEEPAPIDEEDENDENEEEEDGDDDENEGEDGDNGSGDVGQEVNELLIEKVYSYDADGQLSSTGTYEYDELDRQIESDFEYADEAYSYLNSYSTSEYTGNTESRIIRNYNTETGELTGYTEIEYYKYPLIEKVYSYDADGQLSSTGTYEYDELDRQIESDFEYADEAYSYLNSYSTSEYTGNTESRIIRNYNTETGELTGYTEIEYYKYPLIEKVYSYDADGQLSSTGTYEYDELDRQIESDFEYADEAYSYLNSYSTIEYTGNTESSIIRNYNTETGELTSYSVIEYYNP